MTEVSFVEAQENSVTTPPKEVIDTTAEVQENSATTKQPIFSENKLANFRSILDDIEHGTLQALSSFARGKLMGMGGQASDIALDVHKLLEIANSTVPASVNTSVTAEVTSHINQAILELAPILSSSKLFPLVKFACNTRNLTTHTMTQNKLISSFMNMDKMQLKTYQENLEENIGKTQLKLKHVLEFCSEGNTTSVCEKILAIPNDFDSNFQVFSDHLMGVVNTLLNPLSLFDSTDALAPVH